MYGVAQQNARITPSPRNFYARLGRLKGFLEMGEFKTALMEDISIVSVEC